MKKGKGKNSGLLPNSLRIISSCLKTVSTNASTVASTVRSAGATVAASISTSAEDHKDQVTCARFDRLELSVSVFKHVLLLGYQNGFQVLDMEDATNVSELVSKRDGPVSFLQMQPLPTKSNGEEGFISSHPLLLVVAGDDTNGSNLSQNLCHLGMGRERNIEPKLASHVNSPTSVQFYSLRSHGYVHVLRFRSAVHLVRCSPQIVAVGLAAQIYCVDAVTLENKFSVLTYPVPQLAGQGAIGVNIGYGPMAVSTRWLAYASNNPLVSSASRLSPQNLSPSSGVSPSTSPGGSSVVARYAMESSKQLAAGIINLGDMGYRTWTKYCHELLPDGSNSPVSSSSSWKVGRLAGTEMDNAGMVVIKDFVSHAVISQFKAHTSPISALCFDPSGTLLVTASVYGNNINIFRIMPSRSENGLGVQNYDWSASHVHLYRLHRGITSAVIQDICFSHYSQWIGIVSSKGTCHVFVLSPFGGDAGFQSLNSIGDEPSLFPVMSLPWWSTSSCITSQHPSLPPPPVSLSVVSRIKYSSFGWLNTVGNAAGSAAGKVFVPSGAVAAVFHNSVSQNGQHVKSRANSLEHLLVYTPSGHVVQHELLPSIRPEPGEGGSRTESASFVHIQEDDLKVKVEPVQWWDVCRRKDWPEREECIFGNVSEQDDAEIVLDGSGCEDNFGMNFLDVSDVNCAKKTGKAYSVKSHEKSHWYLSNAEVQVSSGRMPIWQKSKICFYVMEFPRVGGFGDGEFEIENIPTHEIEIKQKELLPAFDYFHCVKTGWQDSSPCRGIGGVRTALSLMSEPHRAECKMTQETVICHSKPASLSSTESSECGSSRRIEHLPDLDQMNCENPYMSTCQTMNEFHLERKGVTIFESTAVNRSSLIISSSPIQHSKDADAHVENYIENGLPTSETCLPLVEISDISILSANRSNAHANTNVGGPAFTAKVNAADSGISFQEGHCKALDAVKCCRSTEVITDDVDSSSGHCEKEKPEEEGKNDEFLGSIFAFSEEG
uniref:Uncharacterized protein MANES_01G211900 n=1 Tax=Rhizophora mucronata TaxID=61149 RepID=A0A2P2MCX2_RHIMU